MHVPPAYDRICSGRPSASQHDRCQNKYALASPPDRWREVNGR